MIRLTIRSQTPQEAVLQVDGWVSGGNVSILEEEGMRLLGESQRLVLELKGVQFIDRRGIALLKRWWGERLALRGGSSFVKALLAQHGLTSEERSL
jgi:hypothetical protein